MEKLRARNSLFHGVLHDMHAASTVPESRMYFWQHSTHAAPGQKGHCTGLRLAVVKFSQQMGQLIVNVLKEEESAGYAIKVPKSEFLYNAKNDEELVK